MARVDRRRFLVDSSLTVAGVVAAGAVAEPLRAVAPAAPAPDGWSAVRAQFALAPGLVHLSTFFLVSHPKPVRDAIERYRTMLDADPFGTVERACFGKPEENLALRVKRAAATYLGGRPEEVALTQSTTMGLALAYHGISIRAGQEILTTTHDHYAHHEAQRYAAERAGATWRRIALFDRLEDLPAVTVDAIVARIRAAIRPETRVVGVTWVHSSSGLKLPLREVAAAVREANSGRADADRALLVVDGVHGFGVEDETIAETGCDVFVAGTHKWIFGPRGTGLVWAPEPVWATMRPTIPTFDAEDLFRAWAGGEPPKPPARAAWFTPGGFHAFEHEWAVADAFAYHAAIGRAKIAARIHELNGRLEDGLAEIPHVRLYTPRGHALSAGLVGFDVEGMKPAEVVERLRARRIVASESPYARSIARLAAGIMNTPEEIDAALRAVREIRGA